MSHIYPSLRDSFVVSGGSISLHSVNSHAVAAHGRKSEEQHVQRPRPHFSPNVSSRLKEQIVKDGPCRDHCFLSKHPQKERWNIQYYVKNEDISV